MVKPTPSKRDRQDIPCYVSLTNPVKFRKDYGNPMLSRDTIFNWRVSHGLPIGRLGKYMGFSEASWHRWQDDAYIPEPWRTRFLNAMENWDDQDYKRIRQL